MSCFNTLKKNGFKLTQARKVILDYIHNKDSYLTAEEILDYVHRKCPYINKSTIYRTLELMNRNGCLLKSEFNGRTIYHHIEERHRYHLVCKRCGKTIVCDENIFSLAEDMLRIKHGFEIDTRNVINGLCWACLSSAV